jgi:hypothetical protein
MSSTAVGITLNIMKLVGLVFTGAFGILGLLTEFKDNQTKKITKWEKIALIVIFASTTMSVVRQNSGRL